MRAGEGEEEDEAAPTTTTPTTTTNNSIPPAETKPTDSVLRLGGSLRNASPELAKAVREVCVCVCVCACVCVYV